MAAAYRRRAALAKPDRLRRQAVDPLFPNGIERTPSMMTVRHENEELQMHYHRSRWQTPEPDFPSVKQRVTQAKLYMGDDHAGSFEVTELRPEPLIDDRSFFDWADATSVIRAEMAEVVRYHWEEVSEVSDYGTILELSGAWMNPAYSKGGRFALATKALIDFSKDWSLLILKAFPLEYEGSGSSKYIEAQTRRQRAMMRHYHSALGVTPFPGSEGDGEDGWMYRLRPGLPIAEPVYRAGVAEDDW
ncbi:hypothetical protein [Croceibacterium ferulae]|uniref:hypothetical protein n=1 Tax=Croceibacterium ferulae TaxID=1854641 RepID=UPI000F89C6C7|nr:hypothetical protein [Croceibacterium ferulae]